MEVILVDGQDRQIGTAEKFEAHQQGLLHRAFSIFVFNSKKELLLQKRAKKKYHSGGLWSNTCCSHPQPDEDTETVAHRRLKEEMGFDCPLREVFSFTYKTEFSSGLIEHELDHVFIGFFDGQPRLDPKEAEDWRWMSADQLLEEFEKHPESYTYWLKKSFKKVFKSLENWEK